MAIQAGKKVLKVTGLFRDLTVKGGKQFHEDKKDACRQSINHDLGKGLNGPVAGVKPPITFQDQAEKNQQSRTRSKGGSQESWCHNRCQPETSAGKTCIDEGRYRVDADRPGNREIDQGPDPAGGRDFPSITGQDHPTGNDVDQEITGKDDHVPEKDGGRLRMQQDIHDAGWLAEINEDEQYAHDDGGDSQELTQHGDLSECLVVMQVVGQYQHNGRRSNTYQERELGDIKPPGNVPAHSRNAQTVIELVQIEENSYCHHHKQEDDPDPVSAAAFQGFFQHGALIIYNKSAALCLNALFSAG